MNVAVFCNWGKHRIVAFVELLRERLDDARLSAQIAHMARYCWDRDPNWTDDTWPSTETWQALYGLFMRTGYLRGIYAHIRGALLRAHTKGPCN